MEDIVFYSQIVLLLVVCIALIVHLKKEVDKAREETRSSAPPTYPIQKYKSEDNSAVAVSPVPEYNLTEAKEHYYRLRNQLAVPSGCMRIDMETTVLGIPCRTRVNGQYFKYGFYCWVADDTLYIFPTEDHLKKNYITYSMMLYEKDGIVLDSNDIPCYRIKKSAIEYYRVVGEIRSETQVKSNDVGQYERDAMIGRIIVESALTFTDTVDDKNRFYTRTIRTDERYVELVYYDTQSRSLVLGFGVYLFLKKAFPDKEYTGDVMPKVELDKNIVRQKSSSHG